MIDVRDKGGIRHDPDPISRLGYGVYDVVAPSQVYISLLLQWHSLGCVDEASGFGLGHRAE